MVDTSLTNTFNEAVKYVKSAEAGYKPNRTLKLKMYSLFKQATEGDVNSKRPGILDVVGRAKYDAWKGFKGTSSQEAMQQYIDEVQTVRSQLENE